MIAYKYKNIEDCARKHRNMHPSQYFSLYDAQCALDRIRNKIEWMGYTYTDSDKLLEGIVKWVAGKEIQYKDLKDIKVLYEIIGIDFKNNQLKVKPRRRLYNQSKFFERNVWSYLDWT